jgi:hypothetical protein
MINASIVVAAALLLLLGNSGGGGQHTDDSQIKPPSVETPPTAVVPEASNGLGALTGVALSS